MEPNVTQPKKQGTLAKMEAKLRSWSHKLDELVAQSTGAPAKERRRIEGLRAKHRVVQTKFEKFNAPGVAGKEGWALFKADVAGDWHELEKAFKELEPAEAAK